MTSETPIDFEAELNPAQLAAVQSLDGPHLVIAGAGSGKTRTLVFRVARLVERGVAPESILLLTFTRRAAQEMLRRATTLLDERCRRVAGGTYHSFANLVLRRHAQVLGYGERFTILDRSDASDLVGVLRTRAGFDRRGRRFPRKDTLLDLFSKRVNTNRTLEALLESDYPQFLDDRDDIATLERRYAARKKEQNVMDYDDLLVNLRDLLAEHDVVRRQLSSTFRYVMVDEYQDTNRLQAHIAALLASAHGNLMVVGDDAQSIYGFRGADFRNIMDFPKLFEGCKVIKLEQNYRSIQPILDLGNAILERAQEKFSKRLFTHVAGDDKPALVRVADAYDQADFICDRVLELREEGVPLAEIAVLARAAWHTNDLEIELQRRNLPFRKFGGQRFVEAAHVKDVCALLKIAANPFDEAAWLRILQIFEGVGPATAHKIALGVIAADGDFGALVRPDARGKPYADDLRLLSALLVRLAEAERPLAERLEAAIHRYREWMPRKYDDVNRRLRDLESVQVLAERYDDLETFLTDLAIDPPDFVRRTPDRDPEDEWMTVSTVHSAKGLEWHTVFVVHLNDGQFPNYNSRNDPKALDEERRLLYVAVTRAKRHLYLLKPEQTAQRAYSYEVGELSSLLADVPDLGRLVEERTYLPPGAEGEAAETEAAVGPDAEERLKKIRDYFS